MPPVRVSSARYQVAMLDVKTYINADRSRAVATLPGGGRDSIRLFFRGPPRVFAELGMLSLRGRVIIKKTKTKIYRENCVAEFM